MSRTKQNSGLVVSDPDKEAITRLMAERRLIQEQNELERRKLDLESKVTYFTCLSSFNATVFNFCFS
jgi:hypothetical protein